MPVWITFTFSSLLSVYSYFFCAPLPPVLKSTFDFLQIALLFFLTLWYLPTEDKAGKVQPREDAKQQLTLFQLSVMQLQISVRKSKIADREQAFLATAMCSHTFGSYSHIQLLLYIKHITYYLLHIIYLSQFHDFLLHLYLQAATSITMRQGNCDSRSKKNQVYNTLKAFITSHHKNKAPSPDLQ